MGYGAGIPDGTKFDMKVVSLHGISKLFKTREWEATASALPEWKADIGRWIHRGSPLCEYIARPRPGREPALGSKAVRILSPASGLVLRKPWRDGLYFDGGDRLLPWMSILCDVKDDRVLGPETVYGELSDFVLGRSETVFEKMDKAYIRDEMATQVRSDVEVTNLLDVGDPLWGRLSEQIKWLASSSPGLRPFLGDIVEKLNELGR